MEKLVDMHTHTNYSDGELSLEELIQLAISKNIKALAITDHNTIAGIKSIDRNASFIINSGINIISGIELSAKTDQGTMHILGYNIDIKNTTLNEKLLTLKDNSINSILSILEQLKRDYDIVFGYEDIRKLINTNHNLGRIDIAKLCIKYGYASNIKDAFNKYLISAYNKTRDMNKKMNYQEYLELIRNSGGIPVLAHPKSLNLPEKEFLILLKDMIKYSLEGIEVYHSTHTPEEMSYYYQIANQYNLLISGGSDYHGKGIKPDIELGTGKNHNLKIKQLSLLDKLQS